MSELIEKLAAADAGSGELNLAIWREIDPDAVASMASALRLAGYEPDDDLLANNCEDFTGSIDVALTLKPKNWSWRVGNLPSGRGFADLGTQPSLQCVEGATPALALCIAALKAATPSDCAVKEGGE